MAIVLFLFFVIATLAITFISAKKNTGSSAYFAAGRSITAWQNGLAVAGDYMSAASFLGIAGMIACFGFDGFLYSVGFLVAYLTVLFVVAEPLRNSGKYTMADVLAFRLKARPVRAVASLSTLTVSLFYMIAQMVGAGVLIQKLLYNIPAVQTTAGYNLSVCAVGAMMVIYVVFGGMLATTWVQIIKAILLISGSACLSVLVMKHYNFQFSSFFEAVSQVKATTADGKAAIFNFLDPGMKYKNPWEMLSLGIALLFGTAGLPHILIRFYTVPDAKTARGSVVWAMWIIGIFYILTTFFGFGAATLIGPDTLKINENMSAPELSRLLGGELFFAFICAVAFATILAVVAGLTISASTSFSHDFYSNVIHHGKEQDQKSEIKVARITAFIVAGLSIFIAILLGPKVNVAFLVGLAFAVAASANLPAILFSVFWRRFNTTGAIFSLVGGLVSCIGLILISPVFMGANAIFPLQNPGIASIPIGFLCAIVGTLIGGREATAEAKFDEIAVRSHTGLGAEKASSH